MLRSIIETGCYPEDVQARFRRQDEVFTAGASLLRLLQTTWGSIRLVAPYESRATVARAGDFPPRFTSLAVSPTVCDGPRLFVNSQMRGSLLLRARNQHTGGAFHLRASARFGCRAADSYSRWKPRNVDRDHDLHSWRQLSKASSSD